MGTTNVIQPQPKYLPRGSALAITMIIREAGQAGHTNPVNAENDWLGLTFYFLLKLVNLDKVKPHG